MDDMFATPLADLQMPTPSVRSDRAPVEPPSYAQLAESVGVSTRGPGGNMDPMLSAMPASMPPLPEALRSTPGRSATFPPPSAAPQYAPHLMQMQEDLEQQHYDPRFEAAAAQYTEPPRRVRRPPRKPRGEGGVRGALKTHRVELMAALLVVIAVKFGAPRLAAMQRFGTPTGSLNIVGLVALAVITGVLAKAILVFMDR